MPSRSSSLRYFFLSAVQGAREKRRGETQNFWNALTAGQMTIAAFTQREEVPDLSASSISRSISISISGDRERRKGTRARKKKLFFIRVIFCFPYFTFVTDLCM